MAPPAAGVHRSSIVARPCVPDQLPASQPRSASVPRAAAGRSCTGTSSAISSIRDGPFMAISSHKLLESRPFIPAFPEEPHRMPPPVVRRWTLALFLALVSVVVGAVVAMPAQQMVTETRDPAQTQDEDFARSVKEWTTQPYFSSPLVDLLPKVPGVPSPKDVLGYHIGAPAKLTYYADILKYYRALAAATPRVKVETIGRSDADTELVVVWVSSDETMRNLQQNRDNLAKIADPRG